MAEGSHVGSTDPPAPDSVPEAPRGSRSGFTASQARVVTAAAIIGIVFILLLGIQALDDDARERRAADEQASEAIRELIDLHSR